MWTEDSIECIIQYVRDQYTTTVTERQMIREALRIAEDIATRWNQPCAATQGKKPVLPLSAKDFLERMLDPIGFLDYELDAFAKGEVPRFNHIVPVYAKIDRHYKLWVPCTGDEDNLTIAKRVEELVLKYAQNNADTDFMLEPDPEIEIEAPDILVTRVDWDGLQANEG